MSRHTPETTRPGHVSPTAPESKSASANVWRLLEASPAFVDGMAEAARERDRGPFVPLRRPKTRSGEA